MTAISVVALTGDDLAAALDDLAQLRIRVFRAFPYLYDGTAEYEASYLAVFAAGKDGIIVAAREDETGKIVGCATGSALVAHHEAFAEPFKAQGYMLDEIFYCGESVLLPEYRGRGLGHAFFDQREARARERGYRYVTFSSVIRPAEHPLRPAGYKPLDAFWRKRGYEKAEGIIASFDWKDIDQPEETAHPMQLWIREL
jgi:GNAT superfamily N-acetyltransferase